MLSFSRIPDSIFLLNSLSESYSSDLTFDLLQVKILRLDYLQYVFFYFFYSWEVLYSLDHWFLVFTMSSLISFKPFKDSFITFLSSGAILLFSLLFNLNFIHFNSSFSFIGLLIDLHSLFPGLFLNVFFLFIFFYSLFFTIYFSLSFPSGLSHPQSHFSIFYSEFFFFFLTGTFILISFFFNFNFLIFPSNSIYFFLLNIHSTLGLLCNILLIISFYLFGFFFFPFLF